MALISSMVSRSLVFCGHSKSDKVAFGVRLNKLTPTANGALSEREAQSRFKALKKRQVIAAFFKNMI